MKNKKFQQVMKNLDQLRVGKTKTMEITKEQKEFLIACRDNPVPITWEKITELWKEIGWGDISPTSVRARYNIVKKR